MKRLLKNALPFAGAFALGVFGWIRFDNLRIGYAKEAKELIGMINNTCDICDSEGTAILRQDELEELIVQRELLEALSFWVFPDTRVRAEDALQRSEKFVS